MWQRSYSGNPQINLCSDSYNFVRFYYAYFGLPCYLKELRSSKFDPVTNYMTDQIARECSLQVLLRAVVEGCQYSVLNGVSQPFAYWFAWVISWWRHPVDTFSALLAICAGNSPVTGEFSSQRPVTRNFDVSFDLCLNKRLNEQSWDWWFEMPWRPLWRHCNVLSFKNIKPVQVIAILLYWRQISCSMLYKHMPSSDNNKSLMSACIY